MKMVNFLFHLLRFVDILGFFFCFVWEQKKSFIFPKRNMIHLNSTPPNDSLYMRRDVCVCVRYMVIIAILHNNNDDNYHIV